ncbi:hypothetical protein Droror1_Dr00017795, partial [Drosera rotundifolia]
VWSEFDELCRVRSFQEGSCGVGTLRRLASMCWRYQKRQLIVKGIVKERIEALQVRKQLGSCAGDIVLS